MDISQTLLHNELVVLRTDTLYGLLALASSKQSVEKIYITKGRDFTKPCITLVAAISDIPGLSTLQQSIYLSENKKNPTTLVVPTTTEPDWITRGHENVAYRVCTTPTVVAVLKQTGPLTAPSANPQGEPPARNIAQARHYFGSTVALYVDGGEVASGVTPSQIVAFN